MKDSFVFYSSYADAILQIDSAESQMKVLKAIWDFAFKEIEPLEGSLNTIESIIFSMARPTIEASKRNYENGLKGGRPKKTPLKTPLLTNDNVNVNDTVNVTDNAKDTVNDTDNDTVNVTEKENLNKNNNKFSIPSFSEVEDFAKKQKLTLNVREFYGYYQDTNWENVYNWQRLIIKWDERQQNRKQKIDSSDPYAGLR